MAASGVYSRAFRDHRSLFILAALYGVAVLGQALYLGATPVEILTFCLTNFSGVILASVIFILISYICIYVRLLLQAPVPLRDIPGRHRYVDKEIDARMEAYSSSDIWPYAMMGILILVANSFFTLQKAMLPIWIDYTIDPAVAAFEKFLHFGFYPHEFIVPLIDGLHASVLIDRAYIYWFPFIYTAIGYALFFEADVRLRLKFLWVWVLSWIALGSGVAALMTSTGPIFYHLFYPEPNPYAGLLAHVDGMARENFYYMSKTRALLEGWTTNDKVVDRNAIVAIPSLHIAICWLVILYTKAHRSVYFYPAVFFTLLVFLATVYFGIHYAVDAYISVIGVSFLWWVTGKMLDKKYPCKGALQ